VQAPVFVDELPGVRAVNWQPVLEKLVKKPGQWAIMKRYDGQRSAGADALRLTLRQRYSKKGFEFHTRTVDTSTYVFGRFVGKQ